MTSENTEQKRHAQFISLSIRVPHDPQVAARVRRLALVANARVDDLASIIVQDPSLTIEILGAANRDLDRASPPTASVKNAIIRLGSQALVNLIDELLERTYPNLTGIAETLTYLKRRAVTTSRIARTLAFETRLRWTDECLIAGLLYGYGELLALVKLGAQYQKLASSYGRAHLIYNLQEKFNINLEEVSAAYLGQAEIPTMIVNAIHPSEDAPTGGARSLRPLVLSSVEFLDAFQDQRLSRFAPGRTPPARSAVRMLGFSPEKYERVFGLVATILNQMELNDAQVVSVVDDHAEDVTPQEEHTPLREQSLQTTPINQARPEKSVLSPPAPRQTPPTHPTKPPTPQEHPRVPQAPLTKRTPTPQGPFSMSVKEVTHWIELCEVVTWELCQPHLFLHSAVIVSSGGFATLLFNGPGESLHHQARVIPLHPELADFLQPGLKIKELHSTQCPESPFGAKSYALADLADSRHPQMFVYADCGESPSVPPTAEKTFREVLDVLKSRLSSGPKLSDFPGF